MGLENLNPIVGGINAVGGLVKSIFGDKAEKETNVHDEQIAAFDAVTAEAASQQRENRTWWDSLVDGLNRLPRPLGFFAVLGLMVWAPIDPIQFSMVMKAYELVPEWLALIFGQVILLFFGGRMISGMSFKSKSAKETAEILGQIGQLKALHEDSAKKVEAVHQTVLSSPLAKEVAPERVTDNMDDHSRPLSLDAIEAWNRKNNPGFRE